MIEQVLRVQRGAAVAAGTPRPPIGQTPFKVVHQQDKLRLRYYAPAQATGAPILLVPSLINRPDVLDLEADRSLVAWLAAQGHPTYLVDWGTPGPEDAHEDVAYVVLELLDRAVDRCCRHARVQQVAVLGYCMGGTLAAMHAALRPRRVRRLMLLNAPIDFARAGRFRDLVLHTAVDDLINADGLIPVEAMQPAFKLLDPLGNWTKYLNIDASARDPRSLVRTLARERWLEENVPVSGAFARDFIHNAYLENALFQGLWEVEGQKVDLSAIPCPVHVVACERDFITPSPSALALCEVLPSATHALLPIGHIGVVVGGYGPKVFYPSVQEWLA